jgi:hypothetical protein
MEQVWQTMPEEVRQKTLRTLRRILVRQATTPSNGPEVPHD